MPAIPCGLVAKSIFNDTYELYREVEGEADEKIEITSDNIAWTSDITYKFKNILEVPEGKGTDFMDVQWMNMTDRKYPNTLTISRALHRLDENCRPAQLPEVVGPN